MIDRILKIKAILTPIVISGIVIIGLLAGSCQPPQSASSDTTDSTQVDERKYMVKVMEVDISTKNRTEEYSANIDAWEEIHLGPNQPSQIDKIYVEVGDRVKKGALLVKMDESTLIQAKLQFEDTKLDFQRMDTLMSYGSISQQNYDKAKMAYELSRVQIKNMEDNVYLRAPFSGVITGKYFNEGENYSSMSPNMQTGKACIVSLMAINPLKITINVSEGYWPVLKIGMDVTLSTDIYPDEQFKGKIYKIYPTINPSTKTFVVEIKVPNAKEKLRPGMYAKASINLGEVSAIIVPVSAVLKQQGTNDRYVFLEKENTAKRVLVQIGKRFDDQIEIISGLSRGDNLIIAGHSNLMEGTPVEIIK